MKKLTILFALLTLSAGLWATNSVITFTSTAKLYPYPEDINQLMLNNDKLEAFKAQYPELAYVTTDEDIMGIGIFYPNAFLDANGQVLSFTYNYDDATHTGTITFDGELVTIGTNAFYAKYRAGNLQTIVVPNTVTSIGNYAFEGCVNLSSINLPEGLTSIGEMAFRECRSLSSINLPEGLKNIGIYAFLSCTSLAELTISGTVTIGSSAFANCTSLAELTISGTATIGSSAFSGCKSLVELTIPSTVAIGSYAFSNCSALTKLSVKTNSIGEYAFSGCIKLSSIDFGENVTCIGKGVFYECAGITELIIPSTVNLVGNFAFKKCTSLTKLTVGAENTGEQAFSSCTSLDSITFENSVSNIGSEAFAGCSNVSSVIFLGCTFVENNTFNGVGTAESPADLEIPSMWMATDRPVDSATPWHGGYFNFTPIDPIKQFLGAMGEPCVGCTAVKVSDGETTVILYAPKTIEYIKAVAE